MDFSQNCPHAIAVTAGKGRYQVGFESVHPGGQEIIVVCYPGQNKALARCYQIDAQTAREVHRDSHPLGRMVVPAVPEADWGWEAQSPNVNVPG